MAITTEHIAIAELVVYIPVALVSVFVVLRHGFHRQLGWIYLSILSGIRIAGGIMEIRSHNNPNNTNDAEWGVILQSVGLSPLLLSSLGLLKRVCDEVSTHVPATSQTVVENLALAGGIAGKLSGIYSKRATAASRRSRAVQLLHIPSLIALILSITGGTDQFSSDESEHGPGKTKTRVGVILFLAIYICLFLLCMLTLSETRIMQRSQTRILICVLVTLPLIAVRLLYSLIGDFSNDPNNQFSIINGSPKIQLAMATIEELLVALLFSLLGVFTPKAVTPSNHDDSRVPDFPQSWREDLVYDLAPVNYAKRAAQNAYHGNVNDSQWR